MNNIEEKLTLEEIENRKRVLADYLNIDINQVKKLSYGDYYEADDKEYLIYNENEAYDAAIESVKSIIEDCGVQCINGYENYIQEDYFEEQQQNGNKNYCEDIKQESDSNYENRLIKECVDANIIGDDDFYYDEDLDEIDYSYCLVDMDDLVEQYTEYLCEKETPLEYMLSNYSPKELYKYFPEAIDIDSLAEYVVDVDGKGNCISGYDGKEIEHDGYYIYRTN